MTEPTDFELLELATPYALHAMSDAERAELDRRIAAAPAPVAAAFADEVRGVREAMAIMSAATAVEPSEHLRAATLAVASPATDRQFRWRTAALASAAAAVVVGAAAFGVGVLMRPHPAQTVAEQIMTAPGRADGLPPARQRDGDGDVLSRPQRGCAGDEQCPAAGSGDRLSDVADRVQRSDIGGDDGHRGGDALDDAHVQRLGELDGPGVHRRARQRVAAADQRDIGRAAFGVGLNSQACGRCPISRRAPRGRPALLPRST